VLDLQLTSSWARASGRSTCMPHRQVLRFGDEWCKGGFTDNLPAPHFAGPQSNQLSVISWALRPNEILRNEFL
jgi:hypothetical protein